MSSSPKPSSPPPAYTEVDPSQITSQSSTPSFPTHASYGPTPIVQQQSHILPYYDPRSPYSISEASSRARWRFIGAFFWAVLILALTSVIMGVEVDIQHQPWNGDYWRRVVFGNTDDWSSS